MKNSEVRTQSRPLKHGEKIEKGDLFWTIQEDNRIVWVIICESYTGKTFDATTMCPMRRPITQSMAFIREE